MPRIGPNGRSSGFASSDVHDIELPGPALAGALESITAGSRDYGDLDDDELIGVLIGWQKTEAWAAAGKLSAVAELIRRRPGDRRGPGGEAARRAGLPAPWGKFCADELAAALSSSRAAAGRMESVAHDLATRLPRTARALREGVIDAFKAQIIAEATRALDDADAAAAEALALDSVAGRNPGQIRAAIGRAVLKVDPDAARERRKQAEKDPRVELWREDAGTAALCGFHLPPDEALAADQLIASHAEALKAAGLGGTMDQLRARAYLDILLGRDSRPAPAAPGGPATSTDGPPGSDQPGGPSGAGQPAGFGHPVGPMAQINLTIPLMTLLGLIDHPGEAEGFGPLDADLARDLAGSAAANPSAKWCLTVTDQHGHPVAHGCGRPQRRRRKRGRSKGPPGRGTAPPGQDSGAAGQDSGPPGQDAGPAGQHVGPPAQDAGPPGQHVGPPAQHVGPPAQHVGPPAQDAGPPEYDLGPAAVAGRLVGFGRWRLRPVPGGPDLTVDIEPIAVMDCDHRRETAAHDPGNQLRHLVQIRDAECTWPPCRRAAQRCDFEHAVPWEEGGRTCACNGGPRCRHHHHQKQAAGWRLEQSRPGYHTWTTPAGRTYTAGPVTYPS